MSRTPLFTAAIICFNRATLVRASIESVLSQDFQDYELLIVDDASTDASPQVICEYSDRATIVLRNQNGGEMAARNSAMEHARGEYVCFLDSDDSWFPWTLATFAEAIQRHGSPTGVGGCVFPFRDESKVREVRRGEYADRLASCYFASSHFLGVMSSALRRTAIERAGNFIDRRLNCMDSDLMFRIGSDPGFVQIESPYTLAFREAGGIMGNTDMSYGGTTFLIDSELAGKYPGGNELRLARLEHLTRRTRNISRQCAAQGHYRKAWNLYRRSFGWNLRLGNWKYLAAFPLMIAFPPIRKAMEASMARKHGPATKSEPV